MRSDFEILEEYLANDTAHNRLTESDKLLDKMIVRDTLGFQRYLLGVRMKELIYLIMRKRAE